MIRLALTYGAVASSGAAAWLGFGQGQAELAGAVILAAAAFLAIRLWLTGSVSVRPSLPSRETAATIALVGVIVTAGLAGPAMVQPASATHDCSPLDAFIAGFTFNLVNEDKCFGNHEHGTVEEMNELDANQTHSDIHSAATNQQANQEVFESSYENYLQDTESVAWMKAEVAVAEAYENGSSKSVARQKARQAITDYYATKEANLAESWSVQVHSAQILKNRAAMEANLTHEIVPYNTSGYNRNLGTTTGEYDNSTAWVETNITLVNGSTKEINAFQVTGSGFTNPITPYTGEFTDSGGATHHGITSTDPDGSDDIQIVDLDRYSSLMSEIDTQQSSLKSESDNYVNRTYDAYVNGTINASDVANTNTQMFEYGTRSGNETESLWKSTAALAQLGLDTPTLNGTGTMTVTYQNQQYNGLVMARNAPNGTWEAGTDYDPANIAGPVFLLTTDGKKVELDDTFRINEIRAQDGSQLQNVSTTKYAYKTANTTELQEKQSRLQDLRQEVEDRMPTGGGGGGWGGIGGNPAIVALVAVAAVLLLQRN